MPTTTLVTWRKNRRQSKYQRHRLKRENKLENRSMIGNETKTRSPDDKTGTHREMVKKKNWVNERFKSSNWNGSQTSKMEITGKEKHLNILGKYVNPKEYPYRLLGGEAAPNRSPRLPAVTRMLGKAKWEDAWAPRTLHQSINIHCVSGGPRWTMTTLGCLQKYVCRVLLKHQMWVGRIRTLDKLTNFS